MFCYQCEQTAGSVGCGGAAGVCGKSAEIADLQDALRWMAGACSWYAWQASERSASARDVEVDRFVAGALFTTVTNVDFDPAHMERRLAEGVKVLARAKKLYDDAPACPASGVAVPERLASFKAPADRAGWAKFGQEVGVKSRRALHGDALGGVLEMAAYGLKGASAYAHHAMALGREDAAWYRRLHAELAWIMFAGKVTADEALAHAMAVGDVNMKAMELLDAANTGVYGHPVPTPVKITPVAGKCILVSGHDLKDLHDLLEQTAGKGVNVYTHGEMLPCHGYPGLKKYPHLVGNYGTAWQNQRKEFAAFPGAVLMTTNCIQKPAPDYSGRIFTTGLVAYDGIKHVENGAFGPVVEAALAAPGFTAEQAAGPEKSILVGFGRNAVLGVADKVVGAVKAGAIRHFFLVGGCDGAKPGRNYYTEFVEKTPADTVVLTLACGKYRFNTGSYGDIGGIPRLLDVGQCNDAYSAIQIAVALSKAFGVGVNELPLTLVLSWYEQKAVAILLTLLNLGIKNIRLGPTLPAFVTPDVLNLLVEKFAIKPTSTAEADLAEILGKA